MSKFDTWIAERLGKGIDYDGAYGVQCVDLAKSYLKTVFGISPGSWGNAHCYYDNFNSISALKSNFTRIAYTSGSKPQKGDIVVWSTKLSSSGCGHIAIASGTGTTSYFYSYDQNWTGNHDVCTKIKHTYSCVLGYLRPKDQTKVVDSTTTSTSTTSSSSSSSSPFSTGKNYTLTTNVKVRSGAGTSYSQVAYSKLTDYAKKHAVGKSGVLAKGTVFSCTKITKKSSKEYWGKIASGWIALMYGGTKYCK